MLSSILNAARLKIAQTTPAIMFINAICQAWEIKTHMKGKIGIIKPVIIWTRRGPRRSTRGPANRCAGSEAMLVTMLNVPIVAGLSSKPLAMYTLKNGPAMFSEKLHTPAASANKRNPRLDRTMLRISFRLKPWEVENSRLGSVRREKKKVETSPRTNAIPNTT